MAQTLKHLVETASETVTGMAEKLVSGGQKPLTKLTGCPFADFKNSLTAGPNGPVLMQDHFLVEKLTQFDREKIPARNVHALGTGCYGNLVITNDISQYTRARVFSHVGKKTNVFVRFSGIFTEQGDPDTNRDPRGFAIKFYTEDGNWDLLGINTPVFNVRDGKVGPDAVHAFKRDPRTGMWNPNQTWDFVANHPESLHQTLMIYSNRGGTPMSYRYMHGYGCNTFSFINSSNERFWVKFHLVCENGARGLTQTQAKLVAGEDPNFLSRDLHQAIEQGNYPKWKLCCQIMPEEEGYTHSWTFDCTKVWKHADYPLIDIGTIELNRNPTDYFAEVEQVAFSPANVVPGIGFSPDKLLQGRLLIYEDTQHHRIGPNFKQLYINRPLVEPTTYYVGGNMNLEVKNKFPHYWPNSFGGPQPSDIRAREPPLRCDGPAGHYDYPGEGTDSDYYGQCRDFLRILPDIEKTYLVDNIATSLSKVGEEVSRKVLQHFQKMDPTFGTLVEKNWLNKRTGTAPMTEAEKLVLSLNRELGHSAKV